MLYLPKVDVSSWLVDYRLDGFPIKSK